MADPASINDRWWAVERDSFRAHLSKNRVRAIEILSEYLDQEPASPFSARALGNRAEFFLELGRVDEARRDLLRALEIEKEPTYVRFTLELALGALYEDANDPDGAAALFLQALATALNEGKTAAGGALSRLLRIVDVDRLTKDQRALVDHSIEASWKLLGMQNEPDLADPGRMAQLLLQESSRPR